MTRSQRQTTDLFTLPMFYLGTLAVAAGVHQNPAMLRPIVGWVHTLAVGLLG